MKIILTGGGTAGHIYPLIAVYKEIMKNYPFGGFEFFYIGPKDNFAKKLFSQEGIKTKTAISGKMRRYFSLLNVLDFFKIPIGILQAFYYLFVLSPDVVFSKGGYGSVPVTIAAWILRVPVFLHESDIVPGLANRIGGKFAVEVFISFSINETEYFPLKKMLSVGNPVRASILNGSEEKAKEIFNLTGEKPVILILGGSQGAQNINDKLLSVLPQMLDRFEIIHQTGKSGFEQAKKESEVVLTKEIKKYYHAVDFLGDEYLAHAYAGCNLIISRAGSGSIFEIAVLGKPSILVPLSGSAQDHQIRNAYAFSERGACMVIEEPNFRPHFILERIKYLFERPELMKEMGQKAREFSRPNAAKVIAEYLVTYLNQ
jgi:UDP-N-acetylglucosamine--N-acetylmuramyl-(pentapeptide) pyrophosphoryl-undecaprenol N-acetylglucosamine transferase